MKFLFFQAFFFLLLSFAAPAQINQTEWLMKPGDSVLLRFKIAGEAAPVTTTYRVSDNGTMKLPMLDNEIEAAGITVTALVRRVNDSYRTSGIDAVAELPKREAYVNSGTITVSGAVPKPGKYPLRQVLRVYQAINRAGGFSGKTKDVKILRNKKELPFDLRKILPDGSNNPGLMDGDQIIVRAG